ncbi:MAG: hypothetical protein KKB51_03570 [Candidatus Riflebacteria bacterium]|nr:hypothetical protein [Candidatus Riflebacteria bacterium]
MKKSFTLLILAGLFAFSAPTFAADVNETANTESFAQQAQEVDLDVDNPIEKAFAKDFEMAQATAEINYVNEAYLEAWKAEMANVASVLKKSFTNKEDGKRVDDYVAAYNTLADKAFELEMLNWISDPEESVANRSFGTGATGGAMLAQGEIFQQATLNLIAHYQANPELVYTFIYNGKGADLEKLRAQ